MTALEALLIPQRQNKDTEEQQQQQKKIAEAKVKSLLAENKRRAADILLAIKLEMPSTVESVSERIINE